MAKPKKKFEGCKAYNKRMHVKFSMASTLGLACKCVYPKGLII